MCVYQSINADAVPLRMRSYVTSNCRECPGKFVYARRYIFFFLKNLAFDFQHFSKKKRVFRDAILLIDSVGREWVDSAYQLDRQSVYREGNLELFDSVPN